jgi:hypothetical protein
MKTVRNRDDDTSGGDGSLPKVAKLMHSSAHVPTFKAITVMCAPTPCAPEPGITPEVCKSQLGERTYNLLRRAMLQQQERFTEQLWDLHRLTRAQHRKVVLLPSEDVASAPEHSVPRNVFSRSMQEQVRNDTMNAIWLLPTVPASLRRSFVVNSEKKDKSVKEASPSPADRVCTISGVIQASDPPPHQPDLKAVVLPTDAPAAPAHSGPLFASGLKGKFACQHSNLQGPPLAGFPDRAPSYPYAWAALKLNVPDTTFPKPMAMHGQPPVCAHVNPQYLAGEALSTLSRDALQ